MIPYGIPGSPTYAISVDEIGGMLSRLPDNTANQISAQDVRDVVAGLWTVLTGLSASISSLSAPSVTYTNNDPSTVEVGGLSEQSSFSNISIQDLLDDMLYPYTAPSISLSTNPSVVEFGNSTQTVQLHWSITARKNNIINAYINGPLTTINTTPIPTSFNSSNGIESSISLVTNVTNTFTFNVDDTNVFVTPNTGGIYNTTASVTWSLRRFWGTLPSSSPLVTSTSSNFSYSDINTLNSDLEGSSYQQSREITTNNDYVFFIWPSNSVDLEAFPPVVSINGLSNNDWIKTRDGVTFTNQFGYTASYDVWRFKYVQSNNTFVYVLS